MQIDRKNALKVWETAFGKVVEAVDFVGRKINKSAYDQKSSKYGWVVAYKLPKTQGGRDNAENLLCLHVETAFEKGEEFPFFVANDIKYKISENTDSAGEWIIEEAVDDESLAEKQAKNAAAIEKWDMIFGSEYEKAMDFSGRKIYKSEYNTDSEYAWKIAPYVESKPMENRNVYIAHVKSVEEAMGKTAFKANGKSFTLNKDNGAYYFKAIESKPPKKVFDVKNPYDVAQRLNEIRASYTGNSGTMLDFVVIRAVTKAGCDSISAAAITDTVSMILKESVGEWLATELSEMIDDGGARYMFITYRFISPQPSDFERIFEGVRLLMTYAPVLLDALGLEEMKAYNYATYVDNAHLKYPVGMLSAHYPQLRSLMDSIYASAYGYYAGESITTLYVSHFIVYNVAALSEAHPEDATKYYTEAEMVEHNVPVAEVSAALSAMLSGEQPATDSVDVEVAEVKEEKPTEDLTKGEESQYENEVQNSGVEDETSEPVTDETAVCGDEVSEQAETEAKESEPVKSTAQILARTLSSALAQPKTDAPEKTPAFPISESSNSQAADNEASVIRTPEGEQVTLDIPDNDDQEEEILTLDLDMLN